MAGAVAPLEEDGCPYGVSSEAASPVHSTASALMRSRADCLFSSITRMAQLIAKYSAPM